MRRLRGSKPLGNGCKPCSKEWQTIQPALADFHNALSDEQKARFNTMGRQFFAANRG